MAINEETTVGGIVEPDDSDSERLDATPDPQRGGCLNFGWGCLPVLAGGMLIGPTLFF